MSTAAGHIIEPEPAPTRAEQTETRRRMRKVTIYYATGAPEFERLMDDLTIRCTDAQWERLTRMIDEVDDFMADSDIGSLYQKERVFARRENRPHRAPSPFDDEATRNAKIAALETEFTRKGIPYTR